MSRANETDAAVRERVVEPLATLEPGREANARQRNIPVRPAS